MSGFKSYMPCHSCQGSVTKSPLYKHVSICKCHILFLKQASSFQASSITIILWEKSQKTLKNLMLVSTAICFGSESVDHLLDRINRKKINQILQWNFKNINISFVLGRTIKVDKSSGKTFQFMKTGKSSSKLPTF